MSEIAGLPIEVERDAMNGREMPDGLSYAEQWLYLQLRMLYYQYKMKIIAREMAAAEKRKLLTRYQWLKLREEQGELWVRTINGTEEARARYRKKRTLENADRLLEAIDGNKVKTKRNPDGNIISVGGYKAFSGVMSIRPNGVNPFETHGDWLYRPDTDCWYSKDGSYPAEICEIAEVE